MKKYFLLAFAFIIVGAGCSSVEQNNTDVILSNDSLQTYENDFYAVEYPEDWTFNEQGEPDPTLQSWTYFFKESPAESKGFDAVNIYLYSSIEEGYGYDDKSSIVDAVTGQIGDYHYVINYSANNFPEETKEIFADIVESFQTK